MSKRPFLVPDKNLYSSGGFTFVEILVVIAVLGIISTVIFTTLVNYSARQSLAGLQDDIRNGLIEARQRSFASIDDAVHGAYIGTTSVIFFSGSSYSPGAPASSTLEYTANLFATSSLSGGTNQIIFNKLTGQASATGTIVVIDAIESTYATITVYATGLIE